MKNANIKKILLNKFVSLGLIPILLIFIWFALSLLFNNKVSFSVLLYPQSRNEIKNIPNNLLMKGQKIKGEFKAKDNYLGLILLKFAEYGKHDFSGEDVLIFRLRSHGDKNWSFSNTYRSGLLENNLLFPFGFPVINDSKNKVYDFEIESLLGNKTNGVEINRNSTALFSGYQYPKSEITKNKRSSTEFIFRKIITSFTNIDFLFGSTLYLLPLLIYLGIYLFSSSSKRLNNFKNVITALLFILILTDIFKIKEIYIGILLSLIFSWLFILLINNLKSKQSFIFAIILIVIWVLLIVLGINDYQNKINVWVYTLLCIGLVQAVIEEKTVKQNTLK